MNILISVILLECLCLIGVAADYYLKVAGNGEKFVEIRPFIIGFILHSCTAVGWFLVLKYMKMVQVGVFYSISIIILLAIIGVMNFGESLGTREIVGLLFAIAAVILMGKFA